MECPLAIDRPRHRIILALDIERSTCRVDADKAALRSTLYRLFHQALESAGIQPDYYDGFIDRGDGILALIRPVDQVPKTLLLSHAIPAFSRLLADHNSGLSRPGWEQRQLRVRVVLHAGEVNYDDNGCFGEALDVAFRLLDAAGVKRALGAAADPLILVVSREIYESVVRHGHDGIDQHAFRSLVQVRIAGRRYPGWVHVPGSPGRDNVAELDSYRRLA